MKRIEKLNQIDNAIFEKMTQLEKNTILLQFQQEDTMKWQKIAAQVFVYGFFFVTGVLAFAAVVYFGFFFQEH